VKVLFRRVSKGIFEFVESADVSIELSVDGLVRFVIWSVEDFVAAFPNSKRIVL
jgi:hypothetical protein